MTKGSREVESGKKRRNEWAGLWQTGKAPHTPGNGERELVTWPRNRSLLPPLPAHPQRPTESNNCFLSLIIFISFYPFRSAVAPQA